MKDKKKMNSMIKDDGQTFSKLNSKQIQTMIGKQCPECGMTFIGNKKIEKEVCASCEV